MAKVTRSFTPGNSLRPTVVKDKASKTKKVRRPDQRNVYHAMCNEHLRARDGGGYITLEAARLLRGAIKSAMKILPRSKRDMTFITKATLDHVKEHKVTPAVLAPYLVVRRERLSEPRESEVDCGSDEEGNDAEAEEEQEAQGKNKDKKHMAHGAGYEYKYRSFLRQRIVDGELQVLVDWKPTWEPAGNLRVEDLRLYQKEARDARMEKRNKAKKK